MIRFSSQQRSKRTEQRVLQKQRNTFKFGGKTVYDIAASCGSGTRGWFRISWREVRFLSCGVSGNGAHVNVTLHLL